MNKAFTANINDQVTARGYLDENDQLIMLEPEGSGGGDVTTVKGSITVNGSYSENPAILSAVAKNPVSGYIMPVYIAMSAEAPEEIDVIAGSVFSFTDVVSGTTIHVSGAEVIDEDYYRATGDFSIELTYGE